MPSLAAELERFLTKPLAGSVQPKAEHVSNKVSTTKLIWEDPQFGTLSAFGTGGADLGGQTTEGIFSYAAIYPAAKEVKKVLVGFTGKAPEDGWLFRVTTKELVDCTNDHIRSLSVSVNWRHDVGDSGLSIPLVEQSTNEESLNDVNFVYLKPDGSFVQLEVAVVNRKAVGNLGFYVSFQEICRGQIAKKGEKYVVVPMSSANAYPGADYAKSAVGAQMIIDAAVERKAFAPLDDAKLIEWDAEMPTLPERFEKKGYTAGIVLWFNPSLGAGRVLLADGRQVFVHMTSVMSPDAVSVIDEGGFPLIQPRAPVAVKVVKHERGPRKGKTDAYTYAL